LTPQQGVTLTNIDHIHGYPAIGPHSFMTVRISILMLASGAVRVVKGPGVPVGAHISPLVELVWSDADMQVEVPGIKERR